LTRLLYIIIKTNNVMRKLILVSAFFLAAGIVTAQTEGTQGAEVVKAELPQAAAKGKEISEIARNTEGGREKGKAISSAARRSSMPNERAVNGRANSAKGMEASEAGRARASQMRPANPGNSGSRPDITVPCARPNAPVVRPNAPAPNRPVTPPGGGRPSGL
jgi:hypothetical protein